MNERGDLDLAVARAALLSAAERARLAQALGGEREFAALGLADLERMFGRSFAGKAWNPGRLLAEAAEDRAFSARAGIRFAPYVSAAYPPLLRELADPPTVLYYRGTLPDPERPLAAVVGTRRPSGAGASQAYGFGRQFAELDVPVVSGLALGIDALAHRGNMEGGAPTVAVLGSGLDVVYPKANRALARRIVESGGALLGEYAPRTPPMKWHFPARNRIIAGLARATVVVEAPSASGALITAEFALEQGRDLWVGSAGAVSAVGAGVRALAEDGARIASSAYAVAADWGLFPPPETRRSRGVPEKRGSARERAHTVEYELH